MRRLLKETVFPSDAKTIMVYDDLDYNGAHKYEFLNCTGFENGETKYVPSTQTIQFVQKNKDGTIIPGLQSEQLVLALIDRTQKLNAAFPCPENQEMIIALKQFIDASERRVANRINRGVMGDLKK